MCTNRALVDSLECYMDDLVEGFEDFVKKSVIVISVAIGILVAMIAYLLKTVTSRPEIPAASGDVPRRSLQNEGNRNMLDSSFKKFCCQDSKGTCTEKQTQDEKVLKDIGLTGCPKLNRGSSATRLSIPSLPTACKKCSAHRLSQKPPKADVKKESCCSMCCEDKHDQ